MSQTQENAPNRPGEARVIPNQHVAGSHGDDETGAMEERGRRWYHLRPEPRRRTDLMGFNTVWWALLWIIVIVLAVYPGPSW